MINDFILNKNDRICLIRTLCSRNSFCKMINEILGDYNFYKDSELLGMFLNYTGSPKPIDIILSENLGTKSKLKKNQELKKISKSEFISCMNRIFVIEVVIQERCDLSEFHYLLLFLKYLIDINSKFIVLVSSGRTKTHRYSPIRNEDFFRLSYLMTFFRDTIYFNRIETFTEYESSNKKWNSLSKTVNEKEIGKIVPIFPVDTDIYKIFSSDYASIPSLVQNQSWISKINSLCKNYIDKILLNYKEIFPSESISLLSRDNYLEALLFLSTLFYLLKGKHRLNQKMVIALHESCIDYSQGIIQLIENVITHVTIGEKGCGFFSIRFREQEDASHLYLQDDSTIDAKYYMEIFLTDLQYEKFQGIIEKFYANVEKRIIQSLQKEDNEKFLNNAQFYLSQKEEYTKLESIVKQHYPNMQEQLKNLLDIPLCKISLSNLFLNQPNTPLSYYLSSSENIAFHYGIQIFNNVISVSDGYLFVKSGEGSENEYCNNVNHKYEDIKNVSYKFGTLYVIYIPLKPQNTINSIDSIIVPNTNNTNNNYEFVRCDISSGINGNDKETLCQDLSEKINSEFLSKLQVNPDVSIGIIDCNSLPLVFPHLRTFVYEVLAKSVFLNLAGKNSKINNLAIINVEDKYDVIKIFRQFALFFDRYGKNKLLKQNKNIFIVDKEAKTDIVCSGQSIRSIFNNLCLDQIYGGIDERTIEIIKCLMR